MAQDTALRPDERTLDHRTDPALGAGICSSCAHLETCTLRSEGAIIQFCGEFVVADGPGLPTVLEPGGGPSRSRS